MKFNSPSDWPAEYCDGYRHFDNLIWQVPAWNTAIFSVLIAAWIYIHQQEPNDIEKIFSISLSTLDYILLVIGIFFIASSYYTLLRWRTHQAYTKSENTPYLRHPIGSQLFLQLVLALEAVFLIFLFILNFFSNGWSIWLSIILLISITAFTELYLLGRRKHAESLRYEKN